MTLNLPYNFVPLTPFVLRPEWGSHVSHDHPFQDGWSGELHICLTTHTPLSLGGLQQPASDHEPGKVHFFRTPEERPAIPPSSLKGMLRHVLEIAAFGHFRQVEDKRLGVRDLTKADNFYMKEIVKKPVRAGWLRYRDGMWFIRPVKFVRLHQAELIRALGIDDNNWKRAGTVERRCRLIGALPEIRFDIGPTSANGQSDACNLGRGALQGHIVVTGQPGPDYTHENAKKREFIFYDPVEPQEEILVSPAVMTDFQFIHQESDEWNRVWKPQLHTASPGVPVFWHASAGRDGESAVSSLGLAMMYRLAYRNTLHDAIRNTRSRVAADCAHLDTTEPDLAELLFGRIDAELSDASLRGRVMPGIAESPQDITTKWEGPMVLNEPKPTFYPAYLRQPEKHKAYITLMDDKAQLAGWKRYPVRSEHRVPPPPIKSGSKVQVKLETVPPQTHFNTQIRFHNLRDVELGALVWALDFGGRDGLRHTLGTGKPFGLGQVSVSITDACLVPNDPERSVDKDPDINLEACRRAFVQYMDEAWSQASGRAESRWEDSEPLRQLLAMADPARAADAPVERLGNPKIFVKARQDNERLRPHLGEKESWRDVRSRLGDNASPRIPDFARALEETRRARQQKHEEQERKEKRQAMGPEEILVDDIRKAVTDCEEAPGKSRWNNLNKAIRELSEDAAGWEGGFIEDLPELLSRAKTLATKHEQEKIIKAIKKARGSLGISSGD
ncbi:TIGR03986 family CRISPR-associated RAMP protein [Ectothiorhodospira shaposhnikovii]|uniref:TIGR03986 family type III CRISPR-associated RAMP protein n=1 Tax=Ectothiorhodospira shaposhnikovii TaxID=1054 RepID=UPI00190358FA|nr:TIGR03986 family CRISPR-associated RAMP protein [Ectothiorhodospira shaposhnikovii]MBK1673201.1 TIGR03986 family CRISPR-associated RAMP protein [Ectothiorhodospira shaposhnikovii]